MTFQPAKHIQASFSRRSFVAALAATPFSLAAAPAIFAAPGQSGTTIDRAIDPPSVTAKGVYAYDMASGIVLYEKDQDARIKIGSLTKITTALVVMKYGNLEDEMTVIEEDLNGPGESTMHLEVGDTLTVGTVLYGLLIPSGNDGANLLARHVGGQLADTDDPGAAVGAFVEKMNEFARELGLKNTQYTNPSGLDTGDPFSSAYDVSVLFKLLMEDDKLREIAGEAAYRFTSVNSKTYEEQTTNKLLGQDGVIAGKTGSSEEAGGCVSLARQMDSGNLVIITVVGADLTYTEDDMIDVDERWNDMSAILAAMDGDFIWTTPGADDTFPGLAEELSVWQMEFQDPPTIPYPTSDQESIGYQLVLGEPVNAGEQGGVVVLYYGDLNVGEVPVYQAGG